MVPSILGLCLWAQAPVSLPDSVADYRAFVAAQQFFDAGQYQKVVDALKPVWKFQPISPLIGKAAILAAQSYEQLGQFADALELLRNHAERLPQPDGWLLLARNAEAASDTAGAAAYYQRLFYSYPIAIEAADAEVALDRLKAILGANYPPAMPQTRLERAARLARGGQAVQARKEYAAMALDFGGTQRDLARVRAVANDYRALEALRVTSPEADAERLYSMHTAARNAKQPANARFALEELRRLYPKSRWRLQALVMQANGNLVRNEVEQYKPLYTACYQDFPNEPDASFCHWKIAWAAWLSREGSTMFEEHLRLFPQSDKASAALYFLGRYTELASRYPLSYYTTLAAKKTTLQKTAAPKTKRATPIDFRPSLTMKVRLDRARVLEEAQLPEWAEFELQWAAENESNPFPAALALAETASRRGAHDVSIRYIKRFATGYLSIPIEAAPEKFWKLAFPLPYRSSLESYSKSRGLDPYLVAALVRQESEFNPNALSRAKAYGLTQVLPSTGRQLGRQLGIGAIRADRLFEPDLNLQLGTYYLRMLLDQENGKWEETLASYNAGKSRADAWATWGSFREPAEYIETIPFTETRNYVQIVLRNAYVYRRLYAASER